MSCVVESFKVAVIGAGAAGLAAARVLSRNGMTPIVLEQRPDVGGVWDYESSKDRPMYQNLRTNLPREVMAYREKPWRRGEGETSYVTHRQVLQYLQQYKEDFGLAKFIQYNSKVTQLTALTDSKSAVVASNSDEEISPKIRLEWTTTTTTDGAEETTSQQHEDVFDAVCVANGHYALPSFAKELQDNLKGRVQVLHAIEYDTPEPFRGKTVLCIGGRASGSDLTREISSVAEHVYLSDPSTTVSETQGKVTCVPRTVAIDETDGSILFVGGLTPVHEIDVVIFCTGYEYEFPFLNDQSNVELSTSQRRVTPLYQQLWHAQVPTLSFIGIPHSVVPFPLFKLQMEAVVKQFLQGDATAAGLLPSLAERLAQAHVDATVGGSKQTGRIQDTHFLGDAQWDYCRDLAKMANNYDQDMENFIATSKAIYDHSGGERKGLFPGSKDLYRETLYERHDADFKVVESKVSTATSAQ